MIIVLAKSIMHTSHFCKESVSENFIKTISDTINVNLHLIALITK